MAGPWVHSKWWYFDADANAIDDMSPAVPDEGSARGLRNYLSAPDVVCTDSGSAAGVSSETLPRSVELLGSERSSLPQEVVAFMKCVRAHQIELSRSVDMLLQKWSPEDSSDCTAEMRFGTPNHRFVQGQPSPCSSKHTAGRHRSTRSPFSSMYADDVGRTGPGVSVDDSMASPVLSSMASEGLTTSEWQSERKKAVSEEYEKAVSRYRKGRSSFGSKKFNDKLQKNVSNFHVAVSRQRIHCRLCETLVRKRVFNIFCFLLIILNAGLIGYGVKEH